MSRWASTSRIAGCCHTKFAACHVFVVQPQPSSVPPWGYIIEEMSTLRSRLRAHGVPAPVLSVLGGSSMYLGAAVAVLLFDQLSPSALISPGHPGADTTVDEAVS